MRWIGFLVATMAAILLGLTTVVRSDVPMRLPLDPVRLAVVTGTGNHDFDVEIADESDERARGLMFRDDFPSDRAMLFDFGAERTVAMWMKNTPLSLDMAFLASDGSVVHVARATTPFSLDVVGTDVPVRFVIEFVAGTADRIGLDVGDRLMHPQIERAS